MSDEIRNESQEVKKECKCLCHSEGFKRFLTVALGTFVGVYSALCLFALVHRPPCPPCFGPNPFVRPPMYQGQQFYKQRIHDKGDFHKMKMKKHQIKQELPQKAED